MLPNKIEQRFPSFDKHYEIGCHEIWSFQEEDCRDWYRNLFENVMRRLGSGQHTPIFRISHGEFIMALGYRLPIGASTRSKVIFKGVELARSMGILPAFLSGSIENSYETFARKEIRTARQRYVSCLRNIAIEGYLAAAFVDESSYVPYLADYYKWLQGNKIIFSARNYVPFYSVYAMLMGPDGCRIIKGRRILVVTWLNPEKADRLKGAIVARGANACYFYPVSPSKAMFDRVSVGHLRGKVDIVLIGAGVGAANVIEEVRELGAVCIDCGFVLDVLAYPENRWNRQYCVDDDMFDYKRIRFFSWSDLALFRKLNTLKGRSNTALDALVEYRKSLTATGQTKQS